MIPVRRIVRIVAAIVGGLVLAVVIAGIIIVQTAWFHNMVRSQIVSAVEEATGGTATVGSFIFDWHHLRAYVRDFTIHGLETPPSAPLFHANLVEVDLKLTSPFHGFADIAYLLIDTAQVDFIVYPDGHTNMPAPKVPPKSSNKTGLETIVDLAIGHFDLRNASFTYGDQATLLNASGANFRAQLGYNALDPSYTGQIDINPIHLRDANNAPLDINVAVPLTAHKDQVQITNATFTTPQSRITLSGEMHHLIAPESSAHLNAEIAIDEVRRAAGLSLPLDLARGPRTLSADIAASMNSQYIRIASARMTLGRSSIEASGDLKESGGGAGATFSAMLDLGQLGTMLRVSARPEGTVKLAGHASLNGNNDYAVAGNIEASHVAFREGTTRVSNVSLDSAVSADPHRIALNGLRLHALGAGFTGNAALENMAAFQVTGRLEGLDIETAARMFMGRRLGYNGVISGAVAANGNINKMAELAANVHLAIAPARGRAADIPVSGRLNADYSGRGGAVALAASYIALPHTRIDLSGELNRQIQVKLVSHSFSDFSPLGAIPVTLSSGGAATVNATVTGNLAAPHIAANALVTNFSAQGRPFTRFSADIAASPSEIALSNAVVAHGPLVVQLSANAGLSNWKPLPTEPLRADATIRNADVKDVLALAGESFPMTGAFTLDAHINGSIGSPAGTVDASAVNGTIDGAAYNALTLAARMTPTDINVPTLTLTAGNARIAATADFQHPVNDLHEGSVTAHIGANQVQLADFQSLVKNQPGLAGVVTLNGDAGGALHNDEFTVSSLNANVSANNLAMQGQALGSLTATATSAGTAVHYNVASNFAGSTIHVNGQSELAGNHQTTATASIANLSIARVLAVAGESSLPVKGTLSANAQVSGTLQDPQANGDFTVTNGAAYQAPFTRLAAHVTYNSRAVDVPDFRLEDGPSYVTASLSFNHPVGDFSDGEVQLKLNSNQIQLAQVSAIKQNAPTLGGTLQLTADAAARLRKNAAPLFSTLNANLHASGLTVNKQPMGDLTATASTRGNTVDFQLASDIAHSNVNGSGTVQLTGDYPVNARLTFQNVTYRGLQPLVAPGTPQPFDATVDGSLTVNGPATDVAALNGSIDVTKLEAHSASTGAIGTQPRVQVAISNVGNIQASLNRGVATIQSFHLTGRNVDLALTGTAALQGNRALALHANGNLNLQLLEAFNSEIYSSGTVTLNAAIGGTTAAPDVTGRLQLQKASINLISLPNGLSNANGTIAFTGTEAIVQNLTGETGGGKVTISGVAAYGGPQMQFHMQANANRVHIDYPPTVTTTANATLSLNGTSVSSLLTGRVTILDVSLHQGADIGNFLTAAAAPPSTPTGSTGPLAGMRFDIRIFTSPATQFRTSLTQNLQADANITLLGTTDNPGMLGRVNVTEGDIVFFGSKYTINQGAITFSDPSRINPILNIDLETTVQGIDVSLSVTGPMDQMKLAYRSDPPLQFQQIVSLLASGSVPSTDPVLAAHTPAAPQQSLEQSGASALLGQAVANPVAGRLQRLFGVTKLSIDPQIIGTTNTAQATLTLQQQINRNITFTYIEDVTNSNPQIIRAEWTINPRYSAIAERDVNGEVLVDIFYKRRFH